MAKSFKVEINPAIIKWARETAGFTTEETAAKLNSSKENLEKIEDGKKNPTFRQLEILSHLFKRPLAVFFLPQPPIEPSYSQSFRILPKKEQLFLKDLRLAIRKARYFQSIANELMVDLGIDSKPKITFATTSENPVTVARRERDRIGVTIQKQFTFKNAYEAFNA